MIDAIDRLRNAIDRWETAKANGAGAVAAGQAASVLIAPALAEAEGLRAALLRFIEATDLRDPCDLEDDTRAALNGAKRALGRVWAIRDDELETLWMLDPNDGSHIHCEDTRYLFMSKAAANHSQRHWGGIVVEVTNV